MKFKMNKKLILFLTLSALSFFSLEIYASERSLSHCEYQGVMFGNGKGYDLIDRVCLESFLANSSPAANKKSTNAKMSVFGYRNIIFIEEEVSPENKTISVIAGTSTTLKSVVAVAIDEKNNEIAVLEKSGDILFFSSVITGNVAPFRILRAKELHGSSDLVVDSDKDEVIVVNKTDGALLFFSRLANFSGRKGKRKLDLLKSIDRDLKGIEKVSISLEHRELFVLNKSNNSILTYKLDSISPDALPSRMIKGAATKINKPISLEYLPASDEVKVINSSKEILYFSQIRD